MPSEAMALSKLKHSLLRLRNYQAQGGPHTGDSPGILSAEPTFPSESSVGILWLSRLHSAHLKCHLLYPGGPESPTSWNSKCSVPDHVMACSAYSLDGNLREDEDFPGLTSPRVEPRVVTCWFILKLTLSGQGKWLSQ